MIGAPQTRAELGRPLQMQIPVRLDAQEALPLSCVQAQAQAGEFGGDVGALSITSQPTSGGVMLAVRSAQPLREPILIVRLHLACTYQRTHVYTLLVDPPTPELPMISGSAAAVIAASPSQSAGDSSSMSSSLQSATQLHTEETRPARRRKRPEVTRAIVRRESETRRLHPPVLAHAKHSSPAPIKETPAPAQTRNRLELDDLSASDLMASPELRLATALPSTLPTFSPEQRAQLNQLRQLIMDATATPGEAQPTLQQINALQTRANVLQRQFEQASQQLQRTQSELTQMRAQRYSAGLVYALLAALVALGLLSAWLWRRGANHEQSQSPFVSASEDQRAITPEPETASATPLSGLQPTSTSVLASTIQPAVMPFGLAALVDGRPLQPEIDAPHLESPAPSHWGDSGIDWDSRFMQPMSQDKQVHVDELMDAGHLAEYFIDMGDDDRAMALLEKSLDDSASDSFALPYLLLFDLYRKHDRKKEFDALYTRFERRFNVAVPPWGMEVDPQGQGQNRDLMNYDRAMKLITMTWKDPQIITVLERMLMDDPHQHRMGFELAAYRDLLMLYTVARDIFPDNIPTAIPVEHVELGTRAEPTHLDLDFELPLDAAPAPEADPPEPASSEFKLAPRAHDDPKTS